MIEYLIAVLLPWTILISLLILVIASFFIVPRLLRSYYRLNAVTKLALILIVSLGIYVRFAMVPNTHRIYFDEDRYLSYAITFAKYGEARSIKYADEKTLIGDPDPAVRLTIPVINAVVFRTLGYSEVMTFYFAKVVSSLTVVFIFILAYLLFRSQFVALFASIGMAFLPTILFWSPSTSLDSYFMTFSIIACASGAYYAKTKSFISKVLLASSLFALLCVRLESFLFIPIVIGVILTLRKDYKAPLFSRSELPFLLVVGGIIAVRAVVSISLLGKQWCCAEALPVEAFHFSYFSRNILPNLFQLFNRSEFPYFISIVALISLIQLKKSVVIPLGSWFLGYFVLYSFYYAGMFYSNEFSGSYGRYFLILIPPLLLLAGLGLESLLSVVLKRSKAQKILLGILICSFVVISVKPSVDRFSTFITISPYYDIVDAGPAYIHNYAENYFIPNTPKDSLILASIASLSLITGRSSSLFGLFVEDAHIHKRVMDQLKSGRKVYSSLSLQCEFTPTQCKKLNDLIEFKPVELKKKHPLGIQFAEIKLKRKVPKN